MLGDHHNVSLVMMKLRFVVQKVLEMVAYDFTVLMRVSTYSWPVRDGKSNPQFTKIRSTQEHTSRTFRSEEIFSLRLPMFWDGLKSLRGCNITD